MSSQQSLHSRSAVVLLSMLILVGTAVAEELPLTVVGLQVVPPQEDSNTMVFGTSGGTEVALLVRRSIGGIISFDDEASELRAFVDDQGTNLLDEGAFGNGFGSFPSIEEDGASLLVELEASGVPVAGARTLRVQGKLVVVVAETSASYRSKVIKLEEGAKIEAGAIPLRVSAVGPPEWGDAELSVTLVSDQEIDAIKSIRILGVDGAPIEFEEGSSGSMNMMGSVTVTREFLLPETHPAVIVEIEYWNGMRPVDVPFDLELGVGF